MNAIDTNVYLYALDADEAIKQAKAIALLDQLISQPSETVLMWQVAAEFLSQMRRWESQGKLSPTATEATFNRLTAMFPLQTPSMAVFQTAMQFYSRFRLSHWDSMLLAACQEANVTTLYSEDMDPGTNYNGISIVNPFA